MSARRDGGILLAEGLVAMRVYLVLPVRGLFIEVVGLDYLGEVCTSILEAERNFTKEPRH